MATTLIALVSGILIGLLLGLLGGGGSILTVPVLVYGIGMGVHEATATSLAIVGTNALLGTLGHHRTGNVCWREGLSFGAAAMAGAYGGAWLNHLVDGQLLLVLFSFVMLAAALAMLRSRTATKTSIHPPKSSAEWGRILLAGFGAGLMTGFFGVGGGFLIVPALVLVVGLSVHRAVGTSLLVIGISSFTGLLGHLQYGGINLSVTLLFVAAGAAGIWLGTLLAPRVTQASLRRGFAYFIIVVAISLMARTVLPV